MHYIGELIENFNLRSSKYDQYVAKIIQENGPIILSSNLYKLLPNSKEKAAPESKENLEDFRRKLTVLERGVYQRLGSIYKFKFKSKENKYQLISTLENPSIYEVAFALINKRRYFSHGTALYLLGLSNQKSIEVTISESVKGRQSIHSGKYNPELAKIIFTKGQRTHGEEFHFAQGTVRVLKRVEQDKTNFDSIKPFNSKFKISFSSLESTLIDCVVLPEYCGGVTAVISAFEKADLNLKKLKQCYDGKGFFYPYWQSIGLYLDLTKKHDLASEWMSFFKGNRPQEFFLLKGFRTTWQFNEKWKVWSPTL